MSERSAGLLKPAGLWSMIGLFGGSIGWLAFVAWELGSMPDVLPPDTHRLVATTFAVLICCSVVVQVGVRVVDGQYRIKRELECIRKAVAPALGYPEGYADGLARRPVAPAQRHLSAVGNTDED